MRCTLFSLLVLVVLVTLPIGADPVETKITSDLSHPSTLFGHAVAVDGDTMVVGAYSWGESPPT
ncbi:MAG: hypothetical protein ACYTDY_09505, partial [Planctomycetota bacterium]